MGRIIPTDSYFSDGLKPPTSVSLGFLEQALGTTFTVRALSRIDFGVFSKHLKPQGEQEEALACKVGDFLKKIRAKKPQQPAKEEDIAPEKEIVEAAPKKQKLLSLLLQLLRYKTMIANTAATWSTTWELRKAAAA